MKASQLIGYNQPLEFTETAEIPTLSPSQSDHVLIKVVAAGVNPVDYKIVQGDLAIFVSLTFPLVLGFDFSGIITQKGSNVSAFDVGDSVYGKISPDEAKRGAGSYQEYICISTKSNAIALKPRDISHTDAAGFGVGVMTAYVGLQSQGQIAKLKDPRVLIIGASGGVGIFAIQIAKHFGAHITAVCSGKNADFVKSLGANTVIDYTVGSLETQLSGLKDEFDIVFDAVGGDEYWTLSQMILKPNGVFSTAVGPYTHGGKMTVSKVLSLAGKIVWRKVACSRSYNMITTLPDVFPEELVHLIAQGHVKPVTKHIFSLQDAEAAHDLSRSHRATGKIVLKVSADEK